MTNHLFDAIRSANLGANTLFAETANGDRLFYRDLFGQSAQLASALVNLGISPGDRIAVQTEKTIEAVLLYLAVIRCGAVFVPLNAAYTQAELDYFVNDAQPTLVVCDPSRQIEMETVSRGQYRVETLDARGNGTIMEAAKTEQPIFEDRPRNRDDLAALLYTSGTTGRSKGAMLTHGNLASNAKTLVKLWHFTASDILLHALPIFHTHGLFVATNVVLLAGASMIFLPRFDEDEIIRLLPRATSFMGVPTFYVRLLGHSGLTRETVRQVRLFVSGSAPLATETHKTWKIRTGHDILERYGMTETNMITSNPYDGSRVPGSVGFPLLDVDVRIVDTATQRIVKPGDVGVIEVRGPNVCTGYWRNQEKTRESFHDDGFFVTGDLGRFDERGYLHIVGRSKDLIISGGFNVYPREVEAELDLTPGVAESAVIGLPHPDFGEGVTAIVITRPDAKLDEKTVLRQIGTRLAKYKQPKRILFVDDLPRNAIGKVEKNKLRQAHRDLYSAAGLNFRDQHHE